MKTLLKFVNGANETDLRVAAELIKSRLETVVQEHYHSEFSIGDPVWFRDSRNRRIDGYVVDINPKLIRVETQFGTTQQVAHNIVNKIQEE